MEAHALEDDQSNVDKPHWLSILGQGAASFPSGRSTIADRVYPMDGQNQ